ncbi:MAG: histidine phosphatase family protein [Desulfobulbaceae bacterium]|nr:histidine phosphatase family protein [Desulfobulbaceae bacterium]
MTTTIILARHGATAANLEDRFAGRSSEPLHAKGREQLRLVAEKLRRAPLTGGIVCGPLPRTRESAEIVAGELAVAVRSDERFNEIGIPHWDGLSKTELRQRFGSEYPTWLEAPECFALPGCETLAQVQARAVAGLEELFAGAAGRSTLVISHLIVVRCLVLHYQGLPLAAFRSIKIDNAALTGLRRDGAGETTVEALS